MPYGRPNLTGDYGLARDGVVGWAALPFIAAGTSLFGGVMQGMAGQAAAKQQAAEAQRAAQVGKIKALDTATQMDDELNTTIGNIQAVRAAANVGASPTEAAITDKERDVSNRERNIRVFNINQQVASDEASARFYRRSGRTSLFTGVLGGLAGAASRLQ